MNEKSNYRICKKCLMRDMQNQTEYYDTIQKLLENLDSEEKVTKDLYEERLGICKECEMFLEAMCRTCGCYVELRAAKEKNACPKKKW